MSEEEMQKSTNAYIGLVTDLATGQIDGTITKGSTIEVTGHNIKIEKGEKGGSSEVQLTHQFSNSICINIPLLVNEPEMIKFNIPDSIASGEYTLKIKTCFSGIDEQPLKEENILIYMLKLNII